LFFNLPPDTIVYVSVSRFKVPYLNTFGPLSFYYFLSKSHQNKSAPNIHHIDE
jgi:hypothetical protein